MARLDLRGQQVDLAFQAGDRVAVTLDHGGDDVSASTWDARIVEAPGGGTVATFTVDTTAAASGVVVLSLSAAATAAITRRRSVWYVARLTGSVVSTVLNGAVSVDEPGSRGPGSLSATTVAVQAGVLNVSVSAAAASTPGLANLDGGSPSSLYATAAVDGGTV